MFIYQKDRWVLRQKRARFRVCMQGMNPHHMIDNEEMSYGSCIDPSTGLAPKIVHSVHI